MEDTKLKVTEIWDNQDGPKWSVVAEVNGEIVHDCVLYGDRNLEDAVQIATEIMKKRVQANAI